MKEEEKEEDERERKREGEREKVREREKFLVKFICSFSEVLFARWCSSFHSSVLIVFVSLISLPLPPSLLPSRA